MKLDSIYFSMLRAKTKNPQAHTTNRICDMPQCRRAGTFRAPQMPPAHGKWQFLCDQHIRAYNEAYDYFSNMSQEEFLAFQKSSLVGHRPTWRLGARGPKRLFHDYFQLLKNKPEANTPRKPKLLPRQAKALRVLGLGDNANAEQIKMRFKQLVKSYHPDLHGGGRKYEKHLNAVIQSYNELKKGL